MLTSEKVDLIFPALIKAQSEMTNAKKTCDNQFYKSKYADLAEMIEVTKPVLFTNGMAIIQSPEGSGNTASVNCRIIHTSGQWIEGTITLPLLKSDPQQAGSAITYARRYQLAALFNIAQEDDDGNTASKEEPQKPVTIQTVPVEYGKAVSDLIDWIQTLPPVFNDTQKAWAEKQIADKNLAGIKTAIAKASELAKVVK